MKQSELLRLGEAKLESISKAKLQRREGYCKIRVGVYLDLGIDAFKNQTCRVHLFSENDQVKQILRTFRRATPKAVDMVACIRDGDRGRRVYYGFEWHLLDRQEMTPETLNLMVDFLLERAAETGISY
jgi:hypothetical protein